jgi:hypothetical protein
MDNYLCHKRVKAARITDVQTGPVAPQFGSHGVTRLVYGDASIDGEEATKMCLRGTPNVGDYLVEYEDGYRSVSPKKAFEEGYSLLERQESNVLSFGASLGAGSRQGFIAPYDSLGMTVRVTALQNALNHHAARQSDVETVLGDAAKIEAYLKGGSND